MEMETGDLLPSRHPWFRFVSVSLVGRRSGRELGIWDGDAAEALTLPCTDTCRQRCRPVLREWAAQLGSGPTLGRLDRI